MSGWTSAGIIVDRVLLTFRNTDRVPILELLSAKTYQDKYSPAVNDLGKINLSASLYSKILQFRDAAIALEHVKSEGEKQIGMSDLASQVQSLDYVLNDA